MYVTVVPGGPCCCAGVIVTVGASRTQEAPPTVTLTVAFVPFTPVGVMLTLPAASWKVVPTVRAGSDHELVAGVMSRR